jgi:hypothetical protein
MLQLLAAAPRTMQLLASVDLQLRGALEQQETLAQLVLALRST